MRSIYLGKSEKDGKKSCPDCGGPKQSKPVGWTLGGEPVYACKSKFHERGV